MKELNAHVQTERDKRSGIDRRDPVPMDVPHRMKITEITYEVINAKKVKGARLHKFSITSEVVGKEDVYRPVTDDFFVDSDPNEEGKPGMSEKAINIGQERLIGFFQSAFGFDTPNANDYNEVLRAYQALQGREFLAAIQHQRRCYVSQQDDGTRKLVKFVEPHIWYAEQLAKAATFTVSKGVPRDYNDEEKALLAQFEGQASSAPSGPQAPAADGRGIGSNLDDLPF